MKGVICRRAICVNCAAGVQAEQNTGGIGTLTERGTDELILNDSDSQNDKVLEGDHL